MIKDIQSRFRCTIIRGKAQTDIEDLVPIYCDIIKSCDGNEKDVFTSKFHEHMTRLFPTYTKKAIDNHRTEISHKLYGLYYIDENNCVRISKRAEDFIQSGDLTALFKSLVDLFQQPNGMETKIKVEEKLNHGVKFKPYHFMTAVLLLAKDKDIRLTKSELSYYILDTLPVLQGLITPEEVLHQILADRNNGVERRIQYDDKSSSYCYQHTNEQINTLELTGVIEVIDNDVVLTNTELSYARYLASQDFNTLNFTINETAIEDAKALSYNWDMYYNKEDISTLYTAPKVVHKPSPETSTKAIGDEGENIVYDHEKERVNDFNTRLTNKVIKLGHQRGLGYDIQSIWAQNDKGKEPDATYFIEVKTTKRITAPGSLSFDKITLTRNEWLAANQHKENYAIFRVYLTRSGVHVFKIFDPLSYRGAFCVPINYNYEFKLEETLEIWS